MKMGVKTPKSKTFSTILNRNFEPVKSDLNKILFLSGKIFT